MQASLFDTSIYVAALRARDDGAMAIRRLDSGSILWLSSVVLEELYAGIGEGARRVVERLESDFDGAKRILVPNLTDWTDTGRVLARLAAKSDYEQIGQARLTNDALIAMSAGRAGIRIVTANVRDFRRLAEFRPFHWEIARI